MKKQTLKLGLLGLMCAVSLNAFAAEKRAGSRPGGLGGPGEVPTPFRAANQKVELAPGERYHLVGWVKIIDGAPYLEVDFSEHSWLRNAAREQWPYYSLEGVTADFRVMDGKRVRVFAEAHATILRSRETRSYSYVLSLEPMMPIREIK